MLDIADLVKDLKAQVQGNFKTFGQLYVVDINPDELWDAYLNGVEDEMESVRKLTLEEKRALRDAL